MKTREVKSKVEKAINTNLNAEFQRIARRDEKPFLSNQCKEIEKNSRMGKTRDLFKKIRDTKGTLNANNNSMHHNNKNYLAFCLLSYCVYAYVLSRSVVSNSLRPMDCSPDH